MSDDRTPPRTTIRNAVIHLTNEQPIVVDLFDLPSPTDQVLLCTNVRDMNGKRPIWADQANSTFFFPYQHIRFVEIHPGADGRLALQPPPAQATAPPEEPEADLEIDEDFLRRIREV